MSFLVDVGGRKAWPVRALPWVCGHDGPRWHLDAVDVARALAVDDVEWEDFASVGAWRTDGSPLERACWAGLADELERLRAGCDARDEWQLHATLALPADAFVWEDEWTTAYNRCPRGPDNLRALLDEPDMDLGERRELLEDVAAREIIDEPQVSSGIAEAVMVGARKLSRAPAPEAMLSPEVAPAPKVQGGTEHQTPASPALATRASVTQEPAPDRGRRVKRAALIADNVRRWPTIERDLKDAATNGLSEDAKDGAAVGWWWEGLALEWARARAKVQDVAPRPAGTTSTIHRMEG